MIRIGIGLALAAYAADRAVKWLALEVWDLSERTYTLTPFFDLRLVWNTGVSFGMFQSDLEIGRWLLTGFAVAVILALLVWLGRTRSPLLAVAIGLVIGGAAGNATDRIAWGSVADFFLFHIGDWHFPVFNVADTAVVGGFALIVADGLFARGRRAI